MLFIVSCGNDEDTTAPTIEIIEPTNNQVFLKGQTLNMKLSFNDEYGVRYYSYEIYSEDNDLPFSLYNKKEFNVESLLNSFQIQHNVNIPYKDSEENEIATGNYILKVTAIDHYNNMSNSEVVFKIED